MVDQLIRDIAIGRRNPQTTDLQRIRDHVADAPFNEQMIRSYPDIIGSSYQGKIVQERDTSAFVHLVQRVLVDEQWAYGTTLEKYLADLQEVARDHRSALAVYDRGRGAVATFVGPNHVPGERLGIESESTIVVVYAPDRRSIITGYQASSPERVDIPGDAKWLT